MNTSEAQNLGLVGREKEAAKIKACIQIRRNILLEGPVGVGKTQLAQAIAQSLQQPWVRVDGDARFTEQKLTGWFDPPTVIKKGFSWDSFFQGPLVEAMRTGAILFINEFNRLPEGVQNLLLPAIDERVIQLPRLGELRAHPNFVVIATQNPKDFVATTHLSEALLDRFEWIQLGYQSEDEEKKIVGSKLAQQAFVEDAVARQIADIAVRVVRLTRNHPRIRRGSSVRGAISTAELTSVFVSQQQPLPEAFLNAVLMALPTRIELERDVDHSSAQLHDEIEAVLKSIVGQVLDSPPDLASGTQKKK